MPSHEWVRIEAAKLFEYYCRVDELLDDHAELKRQLHQAWKLQKILEATYQDRLDKLRDAMLDTEPHLAQGLIQAYKIMNGTA